METYRLSSKLRERDREYVVQTANDAVLGSVSTSVFVNGVHTETVNCPHPNEISPQEVLSMVKIAHGEKKKELESLFKAYNEVADRGDPEMMYQLGAAFFYKRFFHEAAEMFEAVTSLSSEHHKAYNHLGMTRLALGEITQAVEAASAGVKLRPGYADYRNNLGEALLADNAPDKAMMEFQQAISINMYYGDAYLNLGLAHILSALVRSDRTQTPVLISQALECMNKAALIFPDHKKHSDFNDGIQALKKNKLSQALTLFKSIREAKKESHRSEFSTFFMRFVLYPGLATERAVADRISFLEAELKKNPTYVDLQTELAHCYLEQARLVWKKGIEQYQKTAEAFPSLNSVSEDLERAESAYLIINRAVSGIAEKG